MPATFRDIPVELLFQIVKGCTVRDVLSVSKTCRYFRAIACCERQLWSETEDAYTIPIPPGFTLDTVALELLPRLATRSVYLSDKFSERLCYPRSLTKLHHWTGNRKSTRPVVHTIGGSGWVLVSKNKKAIFLKPADRNQTPFTTELGGTIYHCASVETTTESYIVAALCEFERAGPDRTLVVLLNMLEPSSSEDSPEDSPLVQPIFSISLPETVENVAVTDTLLALVCQRQLYVINWRDGTGGKLAFSNAASEQSEVDRLNPNFTLFSLHFHPKMPYLILGVRDGRTGPAFKHTVVLLDIPTDMTTLTYSEHGWYASPLQELTWKYECIYDFDGPPILGNVRITNRGVALYDLLVENMDDSNPSWETWTDPTLTICPQFVKSQWRKIPFRPALTTHHLLQAGGSRHSVLTTVQYQNGGKDPEIWYPNTRCTTEDTYTWTRLLLPKELQTGDSVEPKAFDPVTGVLYVFWEKHIYLVQY
ncbi:hypothetical protein SISNIDRAFT_452215 [Sistotremastrum niveocremeum HHB9708]|uniref:F-box domain-containing protein n=2 Tax=Sistotremastraceae TaxID=3402574 RepID=A0A164X1H1_9AGAM|nr:hypothetical protein SISNIDRAFT_452215 [Sistotremastrum niveocremeum HHB9708]KZT41025.1 hypothetical protein SISSUDRAFT_1043322 [Sistotremastrum suecicum HHB10207 ss-3]